MADEGSSEVYAAEEILKKRTKNGRLEYLVKWQNWDLKDSTWEPYEHILDPRLLQQFERKQVLMANERKRGRKPKDLSADRSPAAKKAKTDAAEERKNKVSYISQTLSGRNPKPPERFQVAKEPRSRHKSGANAAHKQRGRRPTSEGEEEEEDEDEVSFRSVEQGYGSASGSSSRLTSPQLSPSSLSPGSYKKAKVGITIKKSPNSDRSFETRILGDDDDNDDVATVESEEEEDPDDEHYESFKSALRDDHGLLASAKNNNRVKKRRRRRSSAGKKSHHTPPSAAAPPSLASSSGVEEVTIDDSDSEYEIEEVVELREWYPPDYWKSAIPESERKVYFTDVTVNDLTVTMTESRTREGFFSSL